MFFLKNRILTMGIKERRKSKNEVKSNSNENEEIQEEIQREKRRLKIFNNNSEDTYDKESENEYNEITIIYDLKKNGLENEDKIRLFGSKFYKRYRNNEIIIDNKKTKLIEYYQKSELYKNDQSNLRVKFIFNKDLTDLSYMFADCSGLYNISNLKNIITKNITSISNMFKNCISLITLPSLSYCNTENITNMSSLFRG